MVDIRNQVNQLITVQANDRFDFVAMAIGSTFELPYITLKVKGQQLNNSSPPAGIGNTYIVTVRFSTCDSFGTVFRGISVCGTNLMCLQ